MESKAYHSFLKFFHFSHLCNTFIMEFLVWHTFIRITNRLDVIVAMKLQDAIWKLVNYGVRDFDFS